MLHPRYIVVTDASNTELCKLEVKQFTTATRAEGQRSRVSQLAPGLIMTSEAKLGDTLNN